MKLNISQDQDQKSPNKKLSRLKQKKKILFQRKKSKFSKGH